jgi:hypothetical protein
MSKVGTGRNVGGSEDTKSKNLKAGIHTTHLELLHGLTRDI